MVDPKPMMIQFHNDAAHRYYQENIIHGIFIGNYKWYNKLKKMGGSIHEVDTEYLFPNSFNMKITPYITKDGCKVTCAHVDESLVKKVINDKRINRGICRWCHHHGDINSGCPQGHDPRYFEPFN